MEDNLKGCYGIFFSDINLRHQDKMVVYVLETFWQALGMYTIGHLALHVNLHYYQSALSTQEIYFTYIYTKM